MQNFPAWFYGPNGASGIFESQADVPSGWQDHPSKVKGAAPAPEGTKTARSPANTTTTAAEAAKTTEAKSQSHTDPKISAEAGVGGMGASPASSPQTAATGEELDADGHPYDPALHAKTRSKTKDGLWRLKVGGKRPAPAPGYPLDL